MIEKISKGFPKRPQIKHRPTQNRKSSKNKKKNVSHTLFTLQHSLLIHFLDFRLFAEEQSWPYVRYFLFPFFASFLLGDGVTAFEAALDVVHVRKAKRPLALGPFRPYQIDIFAVDVVQLAVVAGRIRFGQIRQRIGIADSDIETFRLESEMGSEKIKTVLCGNSSIVWACTHLASLDKIDGLRLTELDRSGVDGASGGWSFVSNTWYRDRTLSCCNSSRPKSVLSDDRTTSGGNSIGWFSRMISSGLRGVTVCVEYFDFFFCVIKLLLCGVPGSLSSTAFGVNRLLKCGLQYKIVSWLWYVSTLWKGGKIEIYEMDAARQMSVSYVSCLPHSLHLKHCLCQMKRSALISSILYTCVWHALQLFSPSTLAAPYTREMNEHILVMGKLAKNRPIGKQGDSDEIN